MAECENSTCTSEATLRITNPYNEQRSILLCDEHAEWARNANALTSLKAGHSERIDKEDQR